MPDLIGHTEFRLLIATAVQVTGEDVIAVHDDFARFIAQQTELWSAVIKKANIRPD